MTTEGPDSRQPLLDPAIVVGHGARATEDLLLRDLAQLLEMRPEGAVPTHPIRVIVSSRPLRDHVAATISRALPRGRVGVVCQTLRSVALQILAAAGEEKIDGAALVPLLARRAARAFAPLRRVLEGLSDGYGAVVASVQDLLDAGVDPALSDGLKEALSERISRGVVRDDVERASALIDVASEVASELENIGSRSPARTYQEAAVALRQRGPGLLPSAFIVFHGWAEATGAATDLIETLLAVLGGRLYLDTPPGPSGPNHVDAGVDFTRRLAERLELSLPQLRPTSISYVAPEIELIPSPNAARESRLACEQVHQLLIAGHSPERIAIVARDLAPYRALLRTHLRRLGVPFSAPSTPGPLVRTGRKLASLSTLLADGAHTEIGRWIELLPPSISASKRASINLVLSAAGAGRLESATAFDVQRVVLNGSIILPAASRETTGDEGEDLDGTADNGESDEEDRGRSLDLATLEETIEAARKTWTTLTDWPDHAPFSEHRAHIDLILADLGWPRDEDFRGAIGKALFDLELRLPKTLMIDREELATLLARELADWGREPCGGAGAGVQLLSALHARSLTFDHLFVLGVNRGGFPRAVSEDSLLPDPLRRILAGSGAGPLPDLPLKREGSVEERYLFAQLLSAGATVHVSWHEQDEQGNSLSPSPLVARMQSIPTSRDSGSAPSPSPRERSSRTALEHTIDAASLSGAGALADLLPVAIEESEGEVPSDHSPEDKRERDADRLARFRVAVVRAFERESFPGESASSPRLGPYHGLVGQPDIAGTPTAGLYVTTLEGMARCPWQLFVERLLDVEPMPDPLASLPGVDAAWVGRIVHRVLEKVVAAATSRDGDLRELEGRQGQLVSWPSEIELERLLGDAAYALMRREGVALEGVATLLAEAARQTITMAHQLEWGSGDLTGVLGAEVEGEVRITGTSTPLRFRADRVDRTAHGLCLTDYKSGRPLSRKKTPKGRRADLRRAVAGGRFLQAVAYALAPSSGGEGRYLYLDPDPKILPEGREIVVESEDEELLGLGRGAIETLITAWQRGLFPPRLTAPDKDQEPVACRTCTVAEACVRGDSSMRHQLFTWGERAITERLASPASSLWRLPLAEGEGTPQDPRAKVDSDE